MSVKSVKVRKEENVITVMVEVKNLVIYVMDDVKLDVQNVIK
jgi:uncharacterized surface protein with fasciclin (FAS1) repeats